MARRRQQVKSEERRRGSKGRLAVALALLMAVVFMVGVMVMFQWRFRSGDVYPPGSSLRTDPVGGRVFYESLAALPGVETMRNFEQYRKLKGGPGATLFMLGTSISWAEASRPRVEVDELTDFVESGARLVMAMNPTRMGNFFSADSMGEEEVEEESKEEKEKREDDEEKSTAEKIVGQLHDSFAERWEFTMELRDERRPPDGWKVQRTRHFDEVTNAELPRWQSSYFLEPDELGPGWEVLARVEKKPVLVRRELGEGEIILATDNYFLSNQALAMDRSPEFLGWVAGNSRRIIFDEKHHGTVRRLNVMQLARRLRLHGFFVGLGLFVILLAWRSGSSLVPGDDELGMGISLRHEVSGEEAAAGFRRLLRRSVGAKELLRTCFETWNEGRSRFAREYSDEQMKKAKEVITRDEGTGRGKGDVVGAYRRVTEILGERE